MLTNIMAMALMAPTVITKCLQIPKAMEMDVAKRKNTLATTLDLIRSKW